MRRWRVDGRVPTGAELLGEGVLCFRLAMHEIDVWRRPRLATRSAIGPHLVDPLLELVSVPVSAVPAQHLDPRAKGDIVAEHAEYRRMLHDPPTQGVFGLESD